MSVAPSYEKYPIVGEVFTENDKTYVNINKNGVLKKVRWYPPKVTHDNIMDFNAYQVYGFAPDGFITLLIGDEEDVTSWCMHNAYGIARCTVITGWYLPCDSHYTDFPDNIQTIKIFWSEISPNSYKLDNFDKFKDVVNKHKYANIKSNSHYQGTVGKWLEKEVTIVKNIETESNYGKAHIHIMEDKNENVYVWITATKNWKENETHYLKMKVKAHHNEQGIEQTIVYYCKEI